MSQSDIDRGMKAQAWLDDVDFMRAFDDIEAGIVAKFKEAKVTDADMLMQCKALLEANGFIRQYFERAAQLGRFESFKVKERAS